MRVRMYGGWRGLDELPRGGRNGCAYAVRQRASSSLQLGVFACRGSCGEPVFSGAERIGIGGVRTWCEEVTLFCSQRQCDAIL